MIIKNHFRKKGFALGLVLKQRLAASRKWSIGRLQKIVIYIDKLRLGPKKGTLISTCYPIREM